MRNVLIAAGNSADPDLANLVRQHLDDASALVRGAAVWALSQLLDEDGFNGLKSNHMAGEQDITVCEEWERRTIVT